MDVNSVIKDGLVEMGARQYVAAVTPFIKELLRDKIEKKTRKLEADLKKLVTEDIFQQAVLLHATQQKNQQTQKDSNI